MVESKPYFVHVDSDIAYYTDYKNSLNEYLESESGNLKIWAYMQIVEEIKDMESIINRL